MDRICPFLALDADLRTVVDAFDPDHRCRAVTPAIALDRGTQTQLCLQAGHLQCRRFAARVEALTAAAPTLPRPASDATFASTRVAVHAEGGAWRAIPRPIPAPRPARLVAAGAAAVAVLGGVAGATTAGFGLLGSPAQAPSRSTFAAATPSPTATPSSASATPTAMENQSALVTASPSPSPAPPATSVTPAPTTTPGSQVYVVQPGDTLNAIAVRFGVTSAVIVEANGLSGDLIVPGQRLTIP